MTILFLTDFIKPSPKAALVKKSRLGVSLDIFMNGWFKHQHLCEIGVEMMMMMMSNDKIC